MSYRRGWGKKGPGSTPKILSENTLKSYQNSEIHKQIPINILDDLWFSKNNFIIRKLAAHNFPVFKDAKVPKLPYFTHFSIKNA